MGLAGGRDPGLAPTGVWPRPGGLRSVVAATAEELRLTHRLERGVASAAAKAMADKCERLRPTDRKDPEPSVDDNPAKELHKQLPSRFRWFR